jgi:hypothetical protein
MGGEIAQVVASAGIPVVLKDIEQRFIDTGLDRAREVTGGQLGGLVKKEKITQEQADAKLEETIGLISTTTEYEGFGDVDFVKITLALQQTRESLRMSALMFQWSLGEEKIQESAGIGYTGLAAVLDKLDHKKPAATRPRQLEASASFHHLPQTREPELPPPLPLPWTERSTSLGQPETLVSEPVRTPLSELRHWSATTASSAHSAGRQPSV